MSSLEEFQRINKRSASVIQIGGFRPTRQPLATNFGLQPMASPGEVWPHSDDRAMQFICQLNLSDAPCVPEILRGLVLITVFMDRQARRLGRNNGDGWILRAYASVDGLQPLTAPRGLTVQRGFECKYELVDDYPVYDDPELRVPSGFERDGVHLDNVRRTKVGGFASNIQSEQWWWDSEPFANPHPSRPRFAFQIDSEEMVGLFWGDNGMLYFARGTAPGCQSEWFLDMQCY